MTDISIAYQRNLRCTATHRVSGVTVHTDAAGDALATRGGGGGGPVPTGACSPTDLLAASLGACVMTTIATAARQRGIDLAGATATVRKELTPAPARRVGRVTIAFHMPRPLPDGQRAALEWAARTCPVRRSLHPELDVPIEFHWGEEAAVPVGENESD